VLISPATDFSRCSVFGPKLKCYFAALQSEQQHAKQQGTAEHAVDIAHLPATPQPRGSEWDYIDAGEGASVAQLYVGARSEADMVQPLVSPALLPTFEGLVQQGMLVMWGGVEAMAPDIAVLASKMQAQGVAVQTCEEANEPHVYCVLPFKGVIRKGAKALVPFIESCVAQQS
jgi:acetyl esterase/lipase